MKGKGSALHRARVLSWSLLCLFVPMDCLAQNEARPRPEINRVIEAIQRREPRAVFDARWLGDPKLIPHLRQLYNVPRFQRIHYGLPELDITLIRLGDTSVMQAYACAFEVGHPGIEWFVLELVLPHIGGTFSIKMYAKVLEDAHYKNWEQRFAKHVADFAEDAGGHVPAAVALFHLAKIVKNPPKVYAYPPGDTSKEERALWLKWLKSNPPPVESPAGLDVDYSGRNCSDAKHQDRIRELERFARL